MTLEDRLSVATQLIREAGDLAAGFFARRATLTRETKGPQDFVSVADREVEALIRTRLAGWRSLSLCYTPFTRGIRPSCRFRAIWKHSAVRSLPPHAGPGASGGGGLCCLTELRVNSGGDLEGVQACRMVEDLRRHHDLIRTRAVDEGLEPSLHRVCGADDRAG